jgi:ParB family chromosome partitioning protein
MADIDVGAAKDRAASVVELGIDEISPGRMQPRAAFDAKSLEDLAASIREHGVLQPIIVRSVPGAVASYEVVVGERRWRAAMLAGLTRVPALVRDMEDVEALQVGIIENVQREDLNPVEEAMGYHQLTEKFGHTQEQVAKALGKSRSHVANMMRLLTLPDGVLNQLRSGALTAGHARALITSPDAEEIAARVVGAALTVRQTEDLVRKASVPKRPLSRRNEKDADTRAIEGDLSASLRMVVSISHGEAGSGGVLSVRYRTLDDLDFLCRVLASADRSTVI